MIKAVSSFPDSPGACFHCGSSNTTNEDEHAPAIEFEGIDFNWGDTPYLCPDCVRVVCETAGRVDGDEHDAVVKELGELREEYDERVEELNDLKSKVERMVSGARAKREAREAVTS